MAIKYKEYSGLNLPLIEQEILQKWNAENAFEKSISVREGAKPFVFYEGPPSANGMPGIHHVISRTLKDLVCRYKTMQGFQVKRKGGWDTHGLPIELGVEKELGITKEDIGKKISVEEYNQKCREAVLRFKDKWDDITRKMGYWVDLNDPYITYKNEYIETVWWLLSELYKKGLLYESVSIQPYSPAAGTGLSSHELNQPGTYKDVKDTSCVAMFKAVKDSVRNLEFANDIPKEYLDKNFYLLAWTTTPWTLPSNLGLAVGPNIKYNIVLTVNPSTEEICLVILAENLVQKYFDTKLAFVGEGHVEILKAEKDRLKQIEYLKKNNLLPKKGLNFGFIVGHCMGVHLEGLRYNQLLEFKANSIEIIKEENQTADPFKVITGDFVTTEDGTGIVHMAPAFGADDFRAGKKNNLGILTLVDKRGKFLEGVKDGIFLYGEEYVKEEYLTAEEKEVELKKQKIILESNGKVKDLKKYLSVDDRIVLKLQEEGKLFKKEKYEHSYPHCWRTDKPILYYPLDAWFIKTTAVKDRMVELNKTINWKPKSTGEGRFGNWLENMVDWNLSRSRFWGTPLPIWKTEDGEEEICIGSIGELTNEFQKAVNAGLNQNSEFKIQNSKLEIDLHKPFIDDIILVSHSGKPMKRVPDLIDVWFDSGAMPYAQWHYPFNNKDLIDNGTAFPADFIAEGVDQTRGWFYTLHAISVMLFDNVAYKTVVSNGLVLDKNGNKMSKRLGNVVDPFTTIENFGADATRWYLITNASPWDNLKFDLDGIKEVQRKFFGTLYNTYQFFSLYANVDGFNFSEKYIPLEERTEIDRWILSSLNTLIKNVQTSLDDYEPTQSGRYIEEFVDEHLSNWYVRLSRRRFWKGEYEHDKICAYQTLYECLETLLLLMAPISPFFSDAIFRNLNAVTKKHSVESIHHALFPKSNKNIIDKALEERMALAQDVSSLILSIRKKTNIKVRQPLQKALIPVLNPSLKEQFLKIEDLVKAEVNIKEIEYLTETEGFIKKKIKPNFIALGKKLGAKMKLVSQSLSELNQSDISSLEKEGFITLNIDSENIDIKLEEVEISAEDIQGWSVANKGNLTVALDLTITEELKKEGEAREFVNRIQNIRKDLEFDLTDVIFLKIEDNSAIINSLYDYKNYICAEILAESMDFVPQLNEAKEIEVNEVKLKISISKKV